MGTDSELPAYVGAQAGKEAGNGQGLTDFGCKHVGSKER